MKIVLGVVAAIACFMLADSLSCNSCGLGISGFCLIPGSVTCGTNTSVCYTSKSTFDNVSSFSGFSIRGCGESVSTCNGTSPTTKTGSIPLVNLAYTVTTTCCSTDKCNNGASATKMTLSVALSAAALAAFWGSYM